MYPVRECKKVYIFYEDKGWTYRRSHLTLFSVGLRVREGSGGGVGTLIHLNPFSEVEESRVDLVH